MKLERTMTATSISFIDQISRGMLLKKLALLKVGRILVQEDFGSRSEQFCFGSEDAPAHLCATLKITHPRAYGRIVLGGSVGGGESYMDGDFECSELTNLIRIFARSPELHMNLDSGAALLTSPLRKLFHRFRNNSIRGSQENIHAHYDIGNDFFDLFLDRSFLYSSGIYKTETTTLEDAQIEKIDRICRKLELKPTDHLLEIGTGWGAFAVHAAKHYGCKVTTTTISEEQHAFAKERIEFEGLSSQIELLFKDYRLLEGKFDKIVSIEMIEAVGLDHQDEYFEKCSSLLKEDGQMLLQAITIRDQQYESARKSVDFIQRYIFPGSGIPSLESMNRSMTRKTDFQIAHVEDFGPHYARTLNEWAKRLTHNHEKVLERGYPERLYRMWQYYFSYCEGGFHERSIGVAQLLLLKPRAVKNPVLGNI